LPLRTRDAADVRPGDALEKYGFLPKAAPAAHKPAKKK
jgi:hypothetical protein